MLFVKHMKLEYTKGVNKGQITAVRIKIAKLSFKVVALCFNEELMFQLTFRAYWLYARVSFVEAEFCF